MTRIALFTVVFIVAVLAAVGARYAADPDQTARYVDAAAKAASRAWDGIEASPVPVLLALGTFLLTVAYHKLRGKTLRESVEVAATRVAVVPVPASEADNPVLRRA